MSHKGIVRLTKGMQAEADSMGMTHTEYLHWLKKQTAESNRNPSDTPAPVQAPSGPAQQQASLFPDERPAMAPPARLPRKSYMRQAPAPGPKPEPAVTAPDRTNELIEETRKRAEAEARIKFLEEKLCLIENKGSNTLDGIPAQIADQVQRALMQRDFEQLKSAHDKLEKEYEKLEKKLEEKDEELEKVEEENESLKKDLDLMAKVEKFTPAIVNGLSHKFPGQAKRIAEGLSGLFSDQISLPEAAELSQEDQELLNLAKQLNSLFPDRSEFQEVLDLVVAISNKKGLLPIIKEVIQRVMNPQSVQQHNVEEESSQEQQ